MCSNIIIVNITECTPIVHIRQFGKVMTTELANTCITLSWHELQKTYLKYKREMNTLSMKNIDGSVTVVTKQQPNAQLHLSVDIIHLSRFILMNIIQILND